MNRRGFLTALLGLPLAGALTAAASRAFAASMADGAMLEDVLAKAAAAEPEAEYSLLVGRLTHRRRAGGWWRQRVAAARRWGRRGRPGRRR